MIGFFAPFLHADVYGQTAASKKADSLKAAREHVADSLRTARTHIADSIKVTRQHRTDSINSVRKRKADSIAFVAKYKNSKKYKDSVAKARKGKPANARAGGTGVAAARDSLIEARKAISDSITATRKARTDSIRTVQKRRADSIGRVQKYKTSKRYADSVAIARRTRSDSVKAVQQHTRDSVAAIRKQSTDSTKTARQHVTDSIKSVRTHYSDSLKVVRKAKTDSLAKVKAGKDKLVKAKEKKKEEDIKLKLELKIKQKREEWSNKKMLKKPWSPVRRFTQNAFTHYNYYYNANRKMDEAELNMQRARKENYDSLLHLFPFDPNKDSSLMAADMDSIIHKVSVGLQIHDPRVKWAGDMYLILGKAYYYKGNYENAAIAFRYIIAEDEAAKKKKGLKKKGDVSIVKEEDKSILSFLQHQSVHNEAILWLARVYSTANQEENASSILSLLESDAKLPESLKGRVAIEKAFSNIRQNNYDAASEQLDIAIEDKSLPNWQRQRAAFLNGQILQNKGDYVAAANSFERVLDFYPKIDMDFYARKNIAYNRLMASNDASVAMIPLKKMLSDGKYSSYYDQVYYVLGKLAQKAGRNEEAIEYLSKSASTPKATKKQKALSFAALGDVYYSTARYPSAKRAYDSASKYSSGGGPKDRDVAVTAAVQRSKALTEISAPGKIIHDQDSLLALAAMSKKEQVAVVRDYLRRLEKEKEDSAANAEAAGVASAREEASEAGGDASSWYFSNPTLMQQGSADFKRKWGTRPLVDNWRRSSALTFAATGGGSTKSSGTEEETAAAPDFSLPTEESLLAKIPTTAAQKDNAAKQIQKAYLQMAKAYFTQLEDYNRTLHTLDTLNTRYPAHGLKEDELYLRYQVAVKQNQLDKAQAISQDLVTRFPNSQYANLLKPSVSESTLAGAKATKEVAEYFDETYRLLQQHQYTEVLVRIDAAKKQYNHPRFKKRFEVLEASAYAGKGEYKVADSLLRGFLKVNAADTLAVWAKNVQDYVIQMKDNGKPGWYDEATAIAAAAAAKGTEAKAPDVAGVSKPAVPPPPPAPEAPRFYSPQPDSEHYSIIVFPGLDSRTAALKQSVKRLDSAKYASAGHQLLIDFYDLSQGVMIIKSFENAAAVKVFNEELMASPAFSAYKEGELKIMAISRQNYKKMFSDKDAQPYFNFYNNNYK